MARISRLPVSPAFPSLVRASILPKPALKKIRHLIATNNVSATIKGKK